MDGYNTARRILEENDDALTRIAEALLERESLDGDEISALVRNEPLPERPPAPEEPHDTPLTPLEQPSDDRTADKPSGLPQPGNQPA